MFTFMITGEPSANREQASRRVIIVGVDDSAEAEAAARWAVREAELRKADVLLAYAYDVPILGPKRRAAAIAHGRQERQALLDEVTTTLTVPASMHIDQLIEIDSPGFLLPRLSENAELTVLGQDHPALKGRTPFGHVASTVASMSRHPIVAVPRGWMPRRDDRARSLWPSMDIMLPPAPSAMPSSRPASARPRCWWCIPHRWSSWRPASKIPG